MPTTARLVAAILYAALGWFAAQLVKGYVPDGQPVGMLSTVAAVYGALVGWIFTGRKLDRRLGTGMGIGLASAFLLVFFTTLTFAGNEMLKRALRKTYDGAVEAVLDTFQITIEYIFMIAGLDVIIVLVFGGVLAGVVTEFVARRYK